MLKEFYLEDEREIIIKGDKGKAFANLHEAEIYLKHLINNRDYYIENKYKKVIRNSYWRWIAVAVLAFLGLCIAGSMAEYGNGVLIQNCFISIGVPCAPIIFYDGFKRFFGKRRSTKEVDHDINILKVKCGYVDEDESVLEEIKTVSKKAEVATTSVDTFIADIRDSVYRITNTRYPGCEQDLKDLCTLAEEYLNAKRRLKTISDTYTLTVDSGWYKRLLEIESRISQNEKIAEDQKVNMEVIDKIKQQLQKEKIDLNKIKESSSSGVTEDSKEMGPTLILGGK